MVWTNETSPAQNPPALLERRGAGSVFTHRRGSKMASRGLRLWSSLSGLAFVILAVVGAIFLFDGPSDSSPAKMTSYYDSASNRDHIHIGWVLTGLGLFALI